MKTMLVPVGWIVSLLAAFFVGQMLADTPAEEVPPEEHPAEVARLRDKLAYLQEELDRERTRRERSRERGARKAAGGPEQRPAAARSGVDLEPVPGAEGEIPDVFSLEGIADAEDGSARFMAFVEAQLGRGEEGYKAILAAINLLWQNRKVIEGLFTDESVATREFYPWVRFLVNREEEMVGLSDYVFRTMAEEPQALAFVEDDNALEIFTEGVGILLPGAVSEERLAVFRGYATKILETPSDQQPKSVSGNRNEIERLVQRFWVAPISVDEALSRLEAGNVPSDEIARLLRRVPADRLEKLDVTALVLPLITKGNNDVLRLLRVLPPAKLDMSRIEPALLEGLQSGSVQEWYASRVVASGGRTSWEQVRPFVEQALARGEKSANAAGQMLTYLPQNLRPGKDYVRDLITRGVLSDGIVNRLKSVFDVQ